jgi:hypothetical protein
MVSRDLFLILVTGSGKFLYRFQIEKREQYKTRAKSVAESNILIIWDRVVEKRYERREDKAKFDEKAEFMPINEYFESNFNAVLSSAIVFQQPVRCAFSWSNI